MAKRRCVFSIKLSTGKQVDFTKKQLMTLMASDQAFVLRDIAKENDIKLTPSEGAEIRQILAGQAKKLKESEAKQEATAEALKEQKKEFTEEKKEMRKVAAERLKEAIAKEKAKTSEVKEKAQEKVEAVESKKAVSDFDKKMAQLEAKEVKAELKEANAEIKNLGRAIKSLLNNLKSDANSKANYKQKIKDIRDFKKGIVQAVNDSLKVLKKGGEIKSAVVKTIIRQALSVDNDAKLIKFMDNVSEIINNASLQDSIDKIVSNQKGARGKRKNNRFTQAVREFTTLPIYDKNGDLTLSEADLEVYAEAVKELNKAIPNHKVMYQMMPNGKTLFDTVMDAKQKALETNESFAFVKAVNDASKLNDIYKEISDIAKTLNKSFDNYKNFKKAVNSAATVINSLYAQGLLSDAQYESAMDNLFKLENGEKIYDTVYQNEINDLKNTIIDNIKGLIPTIDYSEMTETEKAVINELKRIIENNPDFINKLSVEDVQMLNDVVESAVNGFVPEYQANRVLNKLEIKGLNQVNKLSTTLKKITEKLYNLKQLGQFLRLNEAQNYEKLLGILKESPVYQFIVSGTDRAIKKMRSFQTELTNDYFNKLPKLSGKNRKANRFSAGILGHILEHGFKSFNSNTVADDYIGRGLADESIRRSYGDDLKMIEEIYNSFLSNPNFLKDGVDPAKATYGDLDYAKIYDAYQNPSSKAANFDANTIKTYEAARDAFNKTAPLGMASNAMRNTNGMTNPMYIPWSYIDSGINKNTDESLRTGQGQLAIRAGATYERSGNIPLLRPLNFNMDALVQDHVYDIARDYFLTKRLKELSDLYKEAKDNDQLSSTDVQTLRALIQNEKSRMEYELSAGDRNFSKITSAVALQYLVGPRVAVETLTNLLQLSIRAAVSPITLIRSAVNKTRPRVTKIMEASGSSLIEKTKFRSTNHVTLSGGRVMQKESVLKKLNEAINGLSEGMFTGAMWLRSFEKKFAELTGQKWDDSLLNDPKFYYEIKEASTFADLQVQSVLRGASKAQTRQSILLGIQVPYANKFFGKEIRSDSAMGQFIGFFSGFLYNDFQQGIIGSRMLFEKGVRAEGFRKIAGVSANLIAYSLLRSTLVNLTYALWGDDDEKEKAKKELNQLSTPEGVLDYAWTSVLEGFVTFWASGQNFVGRFMTEVALQYAYNVVKDKTEIEELMSRMFMKPWQSKKDVSEAFIPPAFKEVSNMIWAEADALAGKQNVSVSSLIKRIADYAENDRVDDLNPEEYELYQLLAGSWYLGNLIMMTTTGTYIPMTKEMKSLTNQMLDDATIIGGRDLWEAADLDPKKNIKIQKFTKERDEELSALATEKMNNKIDAEREQLDSLVQENNIWALRYELFRLEENSKKEVFNEQGLPGMADYPELPPFTSVDPESINFREWKVSKSKEEARKLAKELLSDSEISNVLNNSSSRVISLFKDVYLPEYTRLAVQNKPLPPLSYGNLAEERDSDGKLIRYIEVPKKK